MQMQQYPSNQQQGLLEDLFTPTTHSWTTFPDEDLGFLHSFGDNTFNEENDSYLASSSTFLDLISSSIQPTFDPNLHSFAPLNVSNFSSFKQQIYEYDNKPKSMASFQEGYPIMVEQKGGKIHEETVSGEKKNKSKNLMAERKRRKRLNDHLSMLRSIVPRISKMDRTSILGDAIEYVKELTEKINTLKGQDMDKMGSFKELMVNEAKPRNPPKFEVERRNMDTHVKICCSTKPGLLLSTVNALEALGLDIQHCVISCFGDFTLQASCSEAPQHMMTSSEEIKQILTRNAGYGGSSL